jgi:hypothetical protein
LSLRCASALGRRRGNDSGGNTEKRHMGKDKKGNPLEHGASYSMDRSTNLCGASHITAIPFENIYHGLSKAFFTMKALVLRHCNMRGAGPSQNTCCDNDIGRRYE